MNELDLDKLAELEAAATPGPWGECGESGAWWVSPIDQDGQYLPQVVMNSMPEDIDQADLDLLIALRNNAQALIAATRPPTWLRVEDELPDAADEFPFLGFDGEIVVGFIGYDEQDGTEYLSIRGVGAQRRRCDPHNYELWLPVPAPLAPHERAMQAEILAAYEAEQAEEVADVER